MVRDKVYDLYIAIADIEVKHMIGGHKCKVTTCVGQLYFFPSNWMYKCINNMSFRTTRAGVEQHLRVSRSL